MSRRLTRASALIVALVMLPPATSHAQMGPPGNGGASCAVSTGGLDFGIYDPLDPAPTDFDGLIDVTCTLDPPPSAVNLTYTLTLTTGNSGQFATRLMQNGPETLAYNVYTDAARLEIWGDGSAGSSVAGGEMRLRRNPPDDVQENRHTVHGRIPAQQNASAGHYTDTLIVTLEF